MNEDVLESHSRDRSDSYDWFVRFWPPLEGRGNPFLPLVDPSYTARMLREQTPSLSRLVVPKVHEIEDAPENA